MEAIHSRVLKTSKDISWFFFLGGGRGEWRSLPSDILILSQLLVLKQV